MDKQYKGCSYETRLMYYETEKRELQKKGLTPQQYEQAILKLCKKLGI